MVDLLSEEKRPEGHFFSNRQFQSLLLPFHPNSPPPMPYIEALDLPGQNKLFSAENNPWKYKNVKMNKLKVVCKLKLTITNMGEHVIEEVEQLKNRKGKE